MDRLTVARRLVTGAAIVLVALFVPESPIKTPSRLDVPGALLLSAGLLALLLALTEGESWGDRKSTRLNSSHCTPSRMPSSA